MLLLFIFLYIASRMKRIQEEKEAKNWRIPTRGDRGMLWNIIYS